MKKGRLHLKTTTTCGKCTSVCETLIFPRNVKTIAAIKSNLRKDGWTLTGKRGWICPTCNYRSDKTKKEKRQKRKEDFIF